MYHFLNNESIGFINSNVIIEILRKEVNLLRDETDQKTYTYAF